MTKRGDIFPPATIRCVDVVAAAGLARLVGMGGRISSQDFAGVIPTNLFVISVSSMYPPMATRWSSTNARAKQLWVQSGNVIQLLVPGQ